MHFSYSHYGNGSKTGKFMLVAGLHVALGAVLLHALGTRTLPLPGPTDTTLVAIEPQRLEPPPPPDPPQSVQRLAPPDIVVPTVELPVAPPPDPSPVAVSHEPIPEPMPATPARIAPQAPPAARTNAGTGPMHSAVFADANSCALPDYPSSAARNGETGTTTLALLVGTDGRVSSARIQQSSGSRTLDRAALNALSMCRFKPAMNNGVPEAGWAQMAYVWKLD